MSHFVSFLVCVLPDPLYTTNMPEFTMTTAEMYQEIVEQEMADIFLDRDSFIVEDYDILNLEDYDISNVIDEAFDI